jgi:hypothetical protein
MGTQNQQERDRDVLEREKVHWGVRMRSKLRKLAKCRMASNMGPGVFSTMGQQALM